MIVILGNPRSGTTLLRLMLTSNESITIPPECGFAVWLHASWADWDIGCVDTKLHMFIDDLIKTRKFETWGLTKEDLNIFLTKTRPDNYKNLVMAVYALYAEKQGAGFPAHLGDKNNFYLHYLDLLGEVFESPFFIHIIRDGRDVACSYLELASKHIKSIYVPKLPTNISDIANEWVGNISRIDDFLSQPGVSSMEIKYENLVMHPKATLKLICGQFECEYSDAMLDFYRLNSSNILEPPEFLKWKEKTTQPLDKSNVGRFRRDLSQEGVDVFISIGSEMLNKHGYK